MSPDDLLLAVPNVSAGRRSESVEAIRDAFTAADVHLLDSHVDGDHNRSVFTIAGTPETLVTALLHGAYEAVSRINMRQHVGLHPAVGALDVCPIVFPSAAGLDPARRTAREIGTRMASELELPVFLYGALATSPERVERHFFRDGGLERLEKRMWSQELLPDFGPRSPHARGGVVLVTARAPIAAFNFELDGGDLEVARAIASKLRESGGGPFGVRAIGLVLGDGRVQVSTNVHEPASVPLAQLLVVVERLAAEHGVRPVAAELVGLLPTEAIAGYPHDRVPIRGFSPQHSLIEGRLAAL